MNNDSEKVFFGVVITCLVGLVLVFGVAAHLNKHPRTHIVHTTKETVKLRKLKPGNQAVAGYAYHDADSNYWWYYTMNSGSSSSRSSATTSYPLASGAGRVTMPAGGTWTRSQNPPKEEEIEEEQEVDIEEAEDQPFTGEQEQQAETSPESEVSEPDTESASESSGDVSGGDTGGDTGGGE